MSSDISQDASNVQTGEQATSSPSSQQSTSSQASADGPLNLERIRAMRQALENSNAPKQNRHDNKPSQKKDNPPKVAASSGEQASQSESSESASQSAVATAQAPAQEEGQAGASEGGRPRGKKRGDKDRSASDNANYQTGPRIAVPTARTPLSDDQLKELESEIENADLEALMIGDKSLQVGRRLEAGQRYPARVLKLHADNVFISLGGPDEGVIPLLQFTDMPQEGQQIEVIVRGFDEAEGLYQLSIPGEAVAVEDWSDLESGAVVEAMVESANTGGLECKIGNIRGFIPMSQISEYRVEDASAYVGKTLQCVITEANERRGNLVLSHRAVLERDKQAKKAERMASISIGESLEGTVRKITDFGAFVDLGGLDGLIHISQLSWEKVKHPSEVLTEGEKVKVRIEKIDAESGKIGLSYRSMQDHPWQDIDARFPVGAVVKGTVSRIAAFGVFVKLAPGIEGLVHISELSYRRVSTASSVVQEGQEVEVKVLSVDREAQRMSLSIKQAQAAPVSGSEAKEEEVAEEPIRKPAVSKFKGQLKGGTGGGGSSGEQFGLKW